MPEKFEDQYLDVLQNIEFALVSAYKAQAEMTDYDALAAVNALIRAYQSETRQQSVPVVTLDPVAQDAVDKVRAMCEWRLGRGGAVGLKARLQGVGMKPNTVDEIVACLKRIRRSIEKWNKHGGRRGYYNFVSEFVR